MQIKYGTLRSLIGEIVQQADVPGKWRGSSTKSLDSDDVSMLSHGGFVDDLEVDDLDEDAGQEDESTIESFAKDVAAIVGITSPKEMRGGAGGMGMFVVGIGDKTRQAVERLLVTTVGKPDMPGKQNGSLVGSWGENSILFKGSPDGNKLVIRPKISW